MANRHQIADKLRGYKTRAHRAALRTVRTNPTVKVDIKATELQELQSWISQAADYIESKGVTAWLETI